MHAAKYKRIGYTCEDVQKLKQPTRGDRGNDMIQRYLHSRVIISTGLLPGYWVQTVTPSLERLFLINSEQGNEKVRYRVSLHHSLSYHTQPPSSNSSSLTTSNKPYSALPNPSQRPLTIPTIPLSPLLYLLSLRLIVLTQQRFNPFTLMRLIQKPILVLCFYDLSLDAIYNAQRDEQIVAVGSKVLSCVVQTAS
jgi:hypothetical protein